MITIEPKEMNVTNRKVEVKGPSARVNNVHAHLDLPVAI